VTAPSTLLATCVYRALVSNLITLALNASPQASLAHDMGPAFDLRIDETLQVIKWWIDDGKHTQHDHLASMSGRLPMAFSSACATLV
jgi:hypothetical protein